MVEIESRSDVSVVRETEGRVVRLFSLLEGSTSVNETPEDIYRTEDGGARIRSQPLI